MKITFLLNTADAMGGTERAIYTQAEYLVREHEVEVLSVFRTSKERFFTIDPRITVRYLVDNTGAVPRPVRESGLDDAQCQALVAADSRIIHKRWEKTFHRLADLELEYALRHLDSDVLVSSSPALMAATTTLSPPEVVTVHQEHRPSQLRGATGDPLFQFIPRLDSLVLLTERTRSWFQDTLRGAAPHLQIIGNALPPGFRPKSSRTTRTVTLAGRVVAEKQIDHAIRAWAKVAEKHPDWILRVLGDGQQLGTLRRLAESLGLNDNVQFLGSVQAMAEEWSKSSIALLTSKDGEALPLVLIEAFTAGVPAVSYDIQTGPAEIITHGENGYIIGSGDIDGLADALGKLIEDEALRHSFGEAALRASEAYSLDRIMGQWTALYGKLVDERQQASRLEKKADRLAAWIAGTGGMGLAPAAPRPDRPLFQRTARDIEALIAERDETLVRSAGQLCILSDDLNPYDAADRNLRLVVDVLEKHGIEYWIVRDHGVRIRVAIHESNRPATLAALAQEWAEQPIYTELISPSAAVSGITLAGLAGTSDEGKRAGGLRIFQPIVTTSRTLRFGPAYGCDVEFWRDEEDGTGMRPLRRTLIGATVPTAVLESRTQVTIRDREYPTLSAFTETLVSDIQFPIDVVYTWVDGDDPAWRAKKSATLEQLGLPPIPAADGDARFSSRDELKYSLRSIAMFAPWVRKIWLVTDDQTPSWLDAEHPGIQVVSHKEIFKDSSALPTFNSHAIESQLHHIDGLAEHFLYFNDDFFIGRPLQPSMFFAANGVAQFFQSPTPVPMTPISADDDFNFAAAKNNRVLIKEAFGHTITQSFLHAPYSLRASVLNELEEQFADAVNRTANSRLRSATDISIPSSLHHYYAYFTGRSSRGSIRVAYVDIGDPDQHPRLTQLLTIRGNDVFCLNDTHHSVLSPAERAQVVKVFLENYFPVPSEFELGSARNRKPVQEI
ncbi:glycosyltransferase involved in cell wall biosynthesis [Actinoplanes lutulentus]|uniref:Glycosyltransferase involved in cell wall biosynthesis n=1 Tax=Actinoplanes lutulentus TaxID=1287878 RepID=A0A327Z5L0_9ACTN|nr:stealth conserved region 3 domain-containing protein [Actinoplanes lutulentus]MBB2944966.1 glycosyltransferase involved in cell wall biosynthesis [Actinoplanes lutulentus]RAK31760.1 glycosyltransferase involved in cell wall biosynthesis [Actinoplanes lutulentus]